MRPTTGTLPVRQALVRVPCHVAPPGNVAPIKSGGEGAHVHHLVGARLDDALAARRAPIAARRTARHALVRRLVRILLLPVRVLFGGGFARQELTLHIRLRMFVRREVHTPPHWPTAIARSGPRAILLYLDVVAAARHTCPTVVAPIGPPRIAQDPVIFAVLAAVTYDADDVVDGFVVRLVLENLPARPVDELFWRRNGAGDGPALQLGQHFSLAADVAELVDAIDVVALLCPATRGIAVPADVPGLALVAHIVPLGLVWLAGLVRQTEPSNPAVDAQGVAAAAAHVVVIAVQQDLHCQIDLAAGAAGGDPDPVRECRSRAEGVASSAVLGDVLVPGHRRVIPAAHRPPIQLRRQCGEVQGLMHARRYHVLLTVLRTHIAAAGSL
mmetsp:Transcript_41631/g.120757  ORF Transcript_41631/g.120757 Transcript_41631/m.120757 type:complete len:385 (-) Transcript_41631:132-1286(-)